MLTLLKFVLTIVGILILALIVFTCLIVGAIFLLGKENPKTKKNKGKYLDCLRQIFGEDMCSGLSVEKCDSKSALIEFDNRTKLATFGHSNQNIKPEDISQCRWHKISNRVYVFIDDNMNGSICSFCYDISSPYFRSMMYLDKEVMRNSHFKKILMSQTGWDLPHEALVVGYIDYSTQQLASELVYFCLSECDLDEIRNQLDALVSNTEGWTKDGNNYRYSKSEDGWTTGISIDYTLGDSFVEVVHFMQ